LYVGFGSSSLENRIARVRGDDTAGGETAASHPDPLFDTSSHFVKIDK